MRKIIADCIYPVACSPIPNGIIITDDSGVILDPLSSQHSDYLSAKYGAEQFHGVICPGFINTHCHLELSYLKNQIEPHKGLNSFIRQLQSIRANFSSDEISSGIESGENEMLENGIVAVGDICNGAATLHQKQKRNLYYHSFIELFGFDPLKAEEFLQKGEILFREFELNGLTVSICPHAPYSTSLELMALIREHCQKQGNILSIHNQESEEENKLFREKKGKMIGMLEAFGFDLVTWPSHGKNSLPVYFPYIRSEANTLLVHNTFSSKDDINLAKEGNVFWSLCPNANLFIENCLPDVSLLSKSGLNITIGTDSLASNKQLSIWEEIKTLKKHYPTFSFEMLIEWGTLNGASFLGLQNQLGSIEKGKKPGLVLLENYLSENSHSKRIL